MKTEEEITKGLEICHKGMCKVSCPYYGDGFDHAINCREELEKDARGLVAQLMEENRALRTECMINRKTTTIINVKNNTPDQTAKQDNSKSKAAKSDTGKPRLTLVPPRIIWDIAAVRQYGVEVKYPETGVDGWRYIGVERIRDALCRHLLAYLATPQGKDNESGLPILWHVATNVAFLCELEDKDNGNIEGCKW